MIIKPALSSKNGILLLQLALFLLLSQNFNYLHLFIVLFAHIYMLPFMTFSYSLGKLLNFFIFCGHQKTRSTIYGEPGFLSHFIRDPVRRIQVLLKPCTAWPQPLHGHLYQASDP